MKLEAGYGEEKKNSQEELQLKKASIFPGIGKILLF